MTPDRFDALYDRYCDGELDALEREEFIGLLDDPACRSRFAEYSVFEAVLAEDVPLRRERRTPRRLVALRLKREPAPAWPWIAASVAGALFILSALAIRTGGREVRPISPVVRETPAVPYSPPAPEVPAPQRPIPPAPLPDPVPEASPRGPEPSPPPAPAPATPVPPRVTPSPPAPPVEKATVPQIASVERVSGRVEIVGASGPVDAELGKPVQAGDGIRSASDGTAVLRFPDGTRVSLGMDTSLARLTETNGKTLALERGIVAIDVVRQPAGRPLAVSTSHAEATALGTAFTVYTTAAFTRLDVTEGRVKFSRPSGVSSVVVPAGHYAIAGAGYDLTVRAAPGLWKAPAQGLLLWLRADAGVKVSEGGVAGWADQSTSGNSASQGAAGRQPTLVAGALGGRPAIRFDGADDFLSLPTGFGDFRAGLSVFFVARIAPGTGWVRLIDLGAGPQADNIFFGRKQTSDNLAFWVYANDQTRGKVDGPGGITSDQAQTLSAVLAPQGKVTLYRNGAAVGTGTTSVPSTGIRKPNYLGKSNYGGTDPYLKADVAEILLFNRALADAERGYVEAYLQAKYFDATFPPAVSRPAEK